MERNRKQGPLSALLAAVICIICNYNKNFSFQKHFIQELHNFKYLPKYSFLDCYKRKQIQ